MPTWSSVSQLTAQFTILRDTALQKHEWWKRLVRQSCSVRLQNDTIV